MLKYGRVIIDSPPRRHVRKTRLGALGGACGTTSAQLTIDGGGLLFSGMANGATGSL